MSIGYTDAMFEREREAFLTHLTQVYRGSKGVRGKLRHKGRRNELRKRGETGMNYPRHETAEMDQ